MCGIVDEDCLGLKQQNGKFIMVYSLSMCYTHVIHIHEYKWKDPLAIMDIEEQGYYKYTLS